MESLLGRSGGGDARITREGPALVKALVAGATVAAMLSLNADAPELGLEGIQGNTVRVWRLDDFRRQWVILFFYPADFTFVCPTEIRGFNARLAEFQARDAAVVAVSVDDIASHRAWATELGGVAFPLLSDPGGKVAQAYGVFDPEDGHAFRATFVISPERRIAYAVASPMNVGRSVEETLRVLIALQTGRLCPADWHEGDATLDPVLKY
jgi:peroxiredoxin (alkyl hydroperoxide reductase subunit C)